MSNGAMEKHVVWEGRFHKQSEFTVGFTFTPPHSSSNGWPIPASRYGDFVLGLRQGQAQRMLEHLAALNLVSPELVMGASRTKDLTSSEDLLITVAANFTPDHVDVSFAEDDRDAAADPKPIDLALQAPVAAIRFLLRESHASAP